MKWHNKGHEFDKIAQPLVQADTAYFYGCGKFAEEINDVLESMKSYIGWKILFIDRDKEKQKKGFHSWTVISPETFFAQEKENFIVVDCVLAGQGEEIRTFLLEKGVPSNRIYKGWDFLYRYFSIYFLYAADKVFFTSQNIVPSTVCNLNCRDCLNFTPHIKKHIVRDIEMLKNDVDLFFNAIDYIYRFQVTGGEPLLYKHIQELFEYIDEHYRKKILRLETVTNGTVLPTDEFCSFLREKNIFVFLDDYTMSLPEEQNKCRAEVKAKLQNYGINFSDNYVEKWFRIYTPENLPSKKSDDELVKMFVRCGNPWSTIEGGSITACNYSLYAVKAGVLSWSEYHGNDFFNLADYTPDLKHELIEFRLGFNERGYVSLCEKCNGFSTINPPAVKPAIQATRRKL